MRAPLADAAGRDEDDNPAPVLIYVQSDMAVVGARGGQY